MLRLQNSITARDDRLLGWLYDHGVLTTEQIAKALFPSLDFAQRRLLRLAGLGLITRFRPNRLDGGSYSYHYVLAQLGYEHVMGQRGLGFPRRDQAKRRLQSLISRADLPHLLGGNNVFIELARHERTHPGAKLADWLPASHFHNTGSFYRPGSQLRIMTQETKVPRPDGAAVWADDGKAVPFFLEFDTGTERLDVLEEKVDKYWQLAQYAEVWAWPMVMVLPSIARERHFHERLPGDPEVVVATTALEYLQVLGKSPADDVWRLLGSGPERVRLVELPYIDAEHDRRWSDLSRLGLEAHG
ncbi:hypothetical protein HDA40_006958 [Hamadaea flava]|uniref:Replication-relaxation family protein n=1 Tax=Hamadaea flava TaxID=1742688 RepID=A0ABV8M0P7_9ACTN|nr:replication-relaxation family protein [Hamadaea flava]MCP2328451.1 hypothetical protein [Hamadaea flava]